MVSPRLPGQVVVGVSGANWSSPALGWPLCVNGTPWILHLLEECVDNAWEYCSVVLGLVSMCCFLLSTFPQVLEAYRNGRVEKAMSFGFLFFIFTGDLTNFLGCYFTRQLPIQVVAGVFYLITDLVIISQFLYYKIKNSSSRKSPALKWLCLMWCGAATIALLAVPKLLLDSGGSSADSQSQTTSESMTTSGYVLGYLASVFYLTSRFPQIYKNFQRQSTEGVSCTMFTLAMLGNGTYGLSVIVVLPALKGSKRTFIIKHLAWLISCMGVLVLDGFVTAQFVMYRKNCPAKSRTPLRVHEVEPLLCDEEEEDEEVELTALQDADMTRGHRGGPPSGDETARSGQAEVLLKREEAEM